MKKIFSFVALVFVLLHAVLPARAASFFQTELILHVEDSGYFAGGGPGSAPAASITITGDDTSLIQFESRYDGFCDNGNGVISVGCWNLHSFVEVSNPNAENITLYYYYFYTIVTPSGAIDFKMGDNADGYLNDGADWNAASAGYGYGTYATELAPDEIADQIIFHFDNHFQPALADEEYQTFVTAWISTYPFSPCDYIEEPSQTFEIDPTIELPLGPTGEPADDQIYEMVTGKSYLISTDGGPWNDGTTDHGKETAVSWDGETWFPFGELTPQCENPDGSIYVIAESDTFYIRVDDTEGNFTDNINNPDPVTYTIALAYPFVPCEDQFMYDPEADLVDTVVVPGNDGDGVPATNALEVGEWYAVTVTSGTWQDEGSPPDRTDMEFRFGGAIEYLLEDEFRDFVAGDAGVWCQSTDQLTWFIQAENIAFDLRVNNETGDFTANTGSLNVSIYHATFERPLEACEIDFELFESPIHDTVDGKLVNGREFVDTVIPFDPTGGGSMGSTPAGGNAFLTAGGWYVLDTTDGPWLSSGGLMSDGSARYDVAVQDDPDGEWIPLEEWSVPQCSVPLDALGHRRIYFQVPTGGVSWRIRVNDSAVFVDNSGFMGWDIYKAIYDPANSGDNPWIACTDGFNLQALTSAISIPVKEENGTYLQPSSLGIVTPPDGFPIPLPPLPLPLDNNAYLSVGDTFAVTITNGPWGDGETEDPHFDAAISSDNGTTWYAFDDLDNPYVSCAKPDISGLYWTVVFTVEADQKWKVRVNDVDGEFTDNLGNLSHILFKVTQPVEPGTIGGVPGSHPSDIRTGLCSLITLKPQMTVELPDPPEEVISLETISYLSGFLYGVVTGTINYLADWLDYVRFNILTYISWCPRNTDSIIALINRFAQKEPIATVNEMLQIMENAQDRLSSYDWDLPVDTSLFTTTGRAQLDAMIRQRFFPNNGTAINPWNGGNVVTFSNHSLPTYFSTCGTVFTSYLPSRIKTGVCFAFAYARESGLSFVMQIFLDIAAVTIGWMSIKGSVQELIYMMTGVKPWAKSGSSSGLEKLLSYFERREREDDAQRELSSRFGGRFQRNKDGTYGR